MGSKLVNVLHEPDSDSDCKSPSVGKEQGQEDINSDWYAHMLIKNHEVTLKLDIGGQCNVLPYYLFKEIGENEIVNSSLKKLVTFTGEKIRTVGKAMIECEYKDKFHVLEFQVVDHNVIPMLGLQTCQDLYMIQKVECVDNVSSMPNVLNEYPEIFHGLGKLKNYKHHIKIDESVPPVIHPSRRVPFALHDKVVVALLFYVHGKHLRSCRDGQLT